MRKVLQKLAPIYEKSALFRTKNRAKPERMDSIFPEDGGDRAPCSENGVPSLERKPCKRKKLFLEKSPIKTAPVLRKERAEFFLAEDALCKLVVPSAHRPFENVQMER